MPRATQRHLGALGEGEQEREVIPASVCRDLVESMSMMVAAVISAKGGHAKC